MRRMGRIRTREEKGQDEIKDVTERECERWIVREKRKD